MDEGTLVRRASAGDRHAFGILARSHQEAVYRWIRRMVRDEDTARDLTQETLLRGFRGLPEFRGEAAFGSWLRTIATNLVRSHARRLGSVTLVPLDPELASPAPAPDARPIAEDDRRALARALAQLPPRQREVVRLRVYEELPYAEIARRLGGDENAARVNFHHALKRLRRLLAEPSSPGVTGAEPPRAPHAAGRPAEEGPLR
jgi:RNA polymerase sigma-70 factor (ECF subfamily)